MTTQAPSPAAVPVPSQDERLLAACAHLSFLTGFWLVAPVAIYVIKRKESRFVAFHALQAAVVQVLFGMAFGVGLLALIVLMAAVGISGHQELAPLIAFAPLFAFVAGPLALFGIHALAAYWAWRGLDGSLPIAGRIARAIQSADEGAIRV
jgi:uncharacterized Tic20 family protein